MTAEEREAFRKIAAIQARRAIARKEVNIERPATAGELAQLARVIDELPDEVLERIASRLQSAKREELCRVKRKRNDKRGLREA